MGLKLSCALIGFEPAQIFFSESRREFSLVWPTLHDSRMRVEENSHESQLSSSFGRLTYYLLPVMPSGTYGKG